MGMAKARSKKRKPKGARKKKRGGVMMGMRGGFKSVANTVAGKEKPKTKKGAVISTLITIALLIIIAAFLLQRYG